MLADFFTGLHLNRRRPLQLSTVCLLSACSASVLAELPFDLSAQMMYDHHQLSGSIFDDEELKSNVSHLRRLKLTLKYDISKRLKVKTSAEYDNEEDKFGIDDGYFDVSLTDHWSLLVGQFKEPFGMENQQSLATQYTTERSVPTNAFTFGRNPGLQTVYSRKRWQWQFAATQVKAKDEEFSDAIAYTTRLTALALDIDQGFIHLGAGWTSRKGSENKYDIDEGLIANGVGNLIGSPKLKADNMQSSNVEFAARLSAFIWQGEYFIHNIEERNNDKHTFYGYYNTLMWTAVGSKRDYDDGEIKFDDASKHTLEFAIRRSYVDLETEQDGDRADTMTVAVNYYYKDALRISLEHQNTDLLHLDDGNDLLVSGESFNARLQLQF